MTKDFEIDLAFYANINNAKEWQALTDKYVFCIDLLGISAWDRDADDKVNALEDAFEAILATAN